VIHGVVMDASAIRMRAIAKTKMIAGDPARHAADMHGSADAARMRTTAQAADMSAPAEAANVPATAKSTHMPATAETSAVTATTTAAAPCIRRADSQCGGKRGRSQDHHHSFHRDTPRI
jgi:hypothetical protein